MAKKKLRWLLGIFLVLAGAVGVGGWQWYRWLFPYGYSHSCDKQLMFALENYAQAHGGAYPAGEATPEASLSLLYPVFANEHVLQGKTVPLEVVRAVLERGERLGPDTCGWHYVEGLRRDDDRRLALFWDKVGLGHNGQRQSDGGHLVFFVGYGVNYIDGDKWEEFLREQEALRKEQFAKRAK